MLTPDEIILRHGTVPYDPQKRHEYYIRTRQLKGKRIPKYVAEAPRPTRDSSGAAAPAQPTKPKHDSKDSKKDHPSQKDHIEHLQKELDRLQDILHELVRKAKIRSGVKVKPKSESSSTTSESKTKKDSSTKDTPDKPKTAAQKREDAKRAKEYREKQQKSKPPSLDRQEAALHRQINDAKERIKKMRETIGSAKSTSGPKIYTESASSVGASSKEPK